LLKPAESQAKKSAKRKNLDEKYGFGGKKYHSQIFAKVIDGAKNIWVNPTSCWYDNQHGLCWNNTVNG